MSPRPDALAWNPCDALGVPAHATPDQARALLTQAQQRATPRERALIDAALIELDAEPTAPRRWWLLSLCGGQRHPWDEALARARRPPEDLPTPPPPTPPRWSNATRARQVGELVDLPALEHDPLFHQGIDDAD